MHAFVLLFFNLFEYQGDPRSKEIIGGGGVEAKGYPGVKDRPQRINLKTRKKGDRIVLAVGVKVVPATDLAYKIEPFSNFKLSGET
jgi:hypothetical protein